MSAQTQGRGRRASARVAIGVTAVALASYPLSGTGTASGLALPATVRSATTSACTAGDLNGDGIGDIAVGVPGEDVGRAKNAGAVNVLLGRADGSYGGGLYLTQESLGQVSETGDAFGTAVVVADVTADGCVDLIVGAPGENASAGQVVVAYGSATGIVGTHRAVLRQGYAGTVGKAEAGDRFGAAVSVGVDYLHVSRFVNGVGVHETGIYVGAPGEDLWGHADAGAVTVFTAAPLTTRGSLQIYQGRRGLVAGVAEAGDRFGAALAGTRLIGAPGEDVGAVVDAGAVFQFDRGDYRQLTQNSPGMPDVAERGDRFGAAVATATFTCLNDLVDVLVSVDFDVIGAPGEDRGAKPDVGYVAHVGGATYNEHSITYDEFGWVSVPAGDEAGRRFGSSLALSTDHLVVGSPGADFSTAIDAGQVATYPASIGCLFDWSSSWWASTGARDALFRGVPERGDAFGTKVVAADGSPGTFLVSAPGETVGPAAGAGALTVVDLTDRSSQELTQNTPGVPGASETGDHFGTPAVMSSSG